MKKNKLQIAIIVVLLLIITVSVSYAYYGARINKTGSNSASVATKSLKLDYKEGPVIELTGILPGQTIIKTFSVENIGNSTQAYNINLKEVVNELTRPDDLVFTLTSDNSGATIAETTFPDMDTTLASNISIASGVKQTYTLTIQYKNLNTDQSADMNKKISGVININDVNTVMMVSSAAIPYSNSLAPGVSTIEDALDDLNTRLGN